MNPNAPSSPLGSDFHAFGWLAQHPAVTFAVGVLSIWVSALLMMRMWVLHRRARVSKKVLWSIVLMIPLFGWLLYGGLFEAPSPSDSPCPPNQDAMLGS
jgi:hypothetical protein